MFDSRTSSEHTLDIDGQAVPLRVRRNVRARRLVLRIDETTGGAVVTIPNRTSVQDGINMARRKAAWISGQLKKRGQPLAFVDGAEVPMMGQTLVVRHEPGRSRTRQCDGEIVVSGGIEYLPRRLTDWLKSQARAELTSRAHEKAARLQVRVAGISVRDTKSRWGSCSARGQLNFSWRLVLAPDYVLDYVVAHEVAHLVHHNHGADFWALTQSLTERMSQAKTWLKSHGRDLHRYGA
jgi:hypothetical protein